MDRVNIFARQLFSVNNLTQDNVGWASLEQIVNSFEQRALSDDGGSDWNPLKEGRAATANVRRLLERAAIHSKGSQSFQIIIQSHQAAVTDLIDRLTSIEADAAKADEKSNTVVEQLTSIMLALLEYLQTVYPNFFSYSFFLPTSEAKRFVTGFNHTWNDLLLEDLPIWNDPESVIKLRAEMQEILHLQPKKGMTYILTRYLEPFLTAVRTYRPVAGESQLEPLIQFTIEVDFNSKGWIDFCVDRMQKNLSHLSDPLERWEKMQAYLKCLSQFTVVPTPANPLWPSLRRQLENWLLAEADFLEKMALPHMRPEMAPSAVKKEPSAAVQCAVSVDQLGIFFRAAKDLALVKAPSLRALFERIAPSLATTSRLQLSADSMRTKSYSPEKRDIESLKEILMQLFKKINSY